MEITETLVADVDELSRLVNSAYRGDTSKKGWTTEADLLGGIRIDEDMLHQYLEDKNSTILKCSNDEDEIVGCVYLKKDNDQMYLGMLTVAPELQARGIGKLLLKAAEEKAIEKGCSRIVMTVITTRHELIDWYKRHGYNSTGETKPFPADERFGKPKVPLEFLVMEKKVSNL